MPDTNRGTLGWDVGGANIKAVRLIPTSGVAPRLVSRSVPLTVEHEAARLVPTLAGLAEDLEGEDLPQAVTMTAELSRNFRTKREGVAGVLDAVERALPRASIRVYSVGGAFLTPVEARRAPLEVAASNWAATARMVAAFLPDCLLIDIGTTTTDIVPIVGGEPAAEGRTDPERLARAELVYTGALRTPCEAVASEVPLGGSSCRVSAEGFALIGDAHLWSGRLAEDSYTVATPDRRPATREFAGERLARLVCADREMLDDDAVGRIAAALAEAQRRTVTAAIAKVHARHPSLRTAVVTGLGDFIAADAARCAGLEIRALADWIGDAARTAPAAAVAWLLAEALRGDSA